MNWTEFEDRSSVFNHNCHDTCLASLFDISADHFQTCKQHLFYEISKSGNSLNLFDNAYQLREPLGFDQKLTFHFVTFLHISLFLSPFHSFWKIETISDPLVPWSAIFSAPE